ncbi:MAG: dihydrofolate reductase [Actinobacteria bacterium]|nr:MAG: dihydrofolate reductase [Actinomycetota bacterium]
MRKLIVSEFLTLDGVMQAPGGPDEDREGGFAHGGWQMPYVDEERGAAILEGFAAADGLLLGRKTYEIFAGYWPSAPEDNPVAGTMNDFAKYVVSRTLEEPLAWKNSTLVKGDIAEAVTGLKRPPGKDILVIGSGDLAQTLMQRDLIDEYRLMIHPLILGSGKRLFRDGNPTKVLKVADSKTIGGVLLLTYTPS